MRSRIIAMGLLCATDALMAPAQAHALPPCHATTSPVRALVALWDPAASSIVVTFYGHPVSSFGLPPGSGQAVEITATRVDTATRGAAHTARVAVLGTMHGHIDLATDGADTRGVSLALRLAPPATVGDHVSVTVVLWRDCATRVTTLRVERGGLAS